MQIFFLLGLPLSITSDLSWQMNHLCTLSPHQASVRCQPFGGHRGGGRCSLLVARVTVLVLTQIHLYHFQSVGCESLSMGPVNQCYAVAVEENISVLTDRSFVLKAE